MKYVKKCKQQLTTRTILLKIQRETRAIRQVNRNFEKILAIK